MKPVRIGICLLIAFSVAAFGGVEEWSQAALEVGATLLLLYWAVLTYRRGTDQIVISPLFFPLVVFAVLVAAQIIFNTTASRYNTRIELQLLAAYIILLHLMTQAFQRTGNWRAFVWFLMSLAFVVSIFGILQQLTFNGKLYWFRTMRYGGYPFGPYVNRNHFAGFAELLIPLALVPLVMGKVRRERLFVVTLFALVPTIALIFSASRGGILSFAVELVILFLLLLTRRVQTKFMVLGGIVVLAAVLSVSWIGFQRVLDRFSANQLVGVTAGKRGAMRQDTIRIIKDHPVIGTGLGTLQMVFPPYDSLYDGRVVNHTHNDYLELLAETGLLGGICCAWFLGVLFLESLKGLGNPKSSFNSAVNLSGIIGCTGILVHSFADFNLRIPANALLFFVAAHLATVRIQSDSTSLPEQLSRRRRVRKHSADGVEQPV